MALPLKPPRDFENITTRECFAAVRTGENGGEAPGGTGAIKPVTVALPILDGGDVCVMTAQPAAATDYGWAAPWYDTSGQNEVRVVVDVEAAGAADAETFGEYSADAGETFAELETPVAAPIADVGPHKSGWVPLASAEIGDRVWRLRARGGDGAATPVVRKAHFQFRQNVAARPPRGGGTPDLPEGIWGTIIHDLNAGMLGTLYADGDGVDFWPDQSPTGYDAQTEGGVVNSPAYRATGFPGGRPCVSTSGLNQRYVLSNPSRGYESWTKYFVLSGLDGGDIAYIWGAQNGYPWAYYFWATASAVAAKVNPNAFTDTTDTAPDTWGMAGAHIYRLVKLGGSATHWYLFVDGVQVADHFCNPQANESTVIALLDPSGGLGMTAKLGREVCYDRGHFNTTGDGADGITNGLTGPEVVLKSTWGTP
jgi:hypothetical protein